MERPSLHSFDLPPGLTWGDKRFLRCMNIFDPIPAVYNDEFSDTDEYYNNDEYENRHAEVKKMPPRGRLSNDPMRKRVRSNLSRPCSVIGKAVSQEEADEISVTREKLMMDFQTEVGKLQEEILKNNTPDDEIAPSKATPANELEGEINDPMLEKRSKRARRNTEKKEERARFSVALSRQEIEDDFIMMTEKKPPRKPNRRPKNIQLILQGLYPGSRLSEVHHDLYK